MGSWHDVYYADLQSLWSLLVAPIAFLVYRFVSAGPAGEREATALDRFVSGYCWLWAVLTMVDPVLGGPGVAALGWSGTFAATAVMFVFVLLGDLRVFVAVLGIANGGRVPWTRALRLLLVVPITTGVLYGGASALVDDLHGQWMWLIYELGFVAMAVWLARTATVRRDDASPHEHAALVRSLLGYVAAYYSLWATADVMILLEIDEGWALRMVPNQLYYALWVPFVYARYSLDRSR